MSDDWQSYFISVRRDSGRFAHRHSSVLAHRFRCCLTGCLLLILLQMPLFLQAAEGNPTELDLAKGAITLNTDSISGWAADGSEINALNPFGYRITGSLGSDLLTSGITVTGGRHRVELQGCLISLTAADSIALQITGDASLTLVLAKDSLNTFSAAAAAVQFGRGLLIVCDAALTIQGEGSLTLQCSAGSAVVASRGSNDVQHLSIEGGRVNLIGDSNKAIGFQGNGSGGSDFTMSDGTVTAIENISTGISSYQRFQISGGSLRATTNCLATAPVPNDTTALFRRILTGLPKANAVDFLSVSTAGSVNHYHFVSTYTNATEASGYLYLWLPLGQNEIILQTGGQTYQLNADFHSELATSHTMTAIEQPLLHVSASAADLFTNSLAAAPETAVPASTQTHPSNSEFSLTAEGERFWYWYDSLNRRVVSLQPTYQARLTRDTFLEAVEKPSGEPFCVVFLALDGQIIATKTADLGSVSAPLQIPYYYGYRFTGWSQDLQQINAHTLVEAQYSRTAGPFAIEVTNHGEITEPGGQTLYAYAANVSAAAAASVAGQVFAGWQANGQIVSYQNPYRFIVSHAVRLTPLYAATAPSSLPLVSLPYLQRETSEAAATAEAVHLITEYEIPAGFTPLECGVLLTFSAMEPNPADLIPGSAAVQFQRSHTPNPTGGTYIVSTSALAAETLYARSYLIYLDSAGREQTVFSMMVCSPAHGTE